MLGVNSRSTLVCNGLSRNGWPLHWHCGTELFHLLPSHTMLLEAVPSVKWYPSSQVISTTVPSEALWVDGTLRSGEGTGGQRFSEMGSSHGYILF